MKTDCVIRSVFFFVRQEDGHEVPCSVRAFVARSIEFDAVRCGTNGGNFTLKVIRDGVVSNIASNQVPEQSEVSHYYFNLDDAKEVLSTAVIKIVLGGNLSSSKQYAFANLKVNGYVRSATPVSITPAKDMVTFSSEKALDFSTPISGLKAYAVSSVGEGYAVLSEVTTAVPANTGLIIKATAETEYEIPVANGTPEAITNLLVAGSKELAAGEAYILSDGKFVPAAAGTLPAGKAYLPVTSGARSLTIVFEGEATGISTMKSVESTNNEIYNLNGQRVVSDSAIICSSSIFSTSMSGCIYVFFIIICVFSFITN